MITTIIGLAAVAAAQGSAEHVVQGELPGFHVGNHAENLSGMIIEQVPAGESVEQWTRMVTVQRFSGAAQRLRPEELLDNMSRGLTTSCPGARTSPISRLTVSGRPAARFRADCPRNPATELPETFIALAIAGANDLHVAQVAFRRVPSGADSAWAEQQIGTVVLCGGQSGDTACADTGK